MATDTLVHNQLLTDRCAILTPPDSAGIADGLIAALTDSARVAQVLQAAEQMLTLYCSPASRDAAYAAVFSAAAAASVGKRLHTEHDLTPDQRA